MKLITFYRLFAICAVSTTLFGCASYPAQQGQYRNHCQPNYSAVALGAIAGGLVGSSFGAGVGRDLSIAAGAATGAYLANDSSCK